jgi:hypothetical protein
MKTTIVTVDRIENDIAVLEFENHTYDVPLSILPNINEGDQLEITRVGSLQNERNEAEERLNRLKKNSPKGNIIDL